jgi:hypothetical protein
LSWRATLFSSGSGSDIATPLALSNSQKIPLLRNMKQIIQVRTDLWNLTDRLHDIVCYQIRRLWVR